MRIAVKKWQKTGIFGISKAGAKLVNPASPTDITALLEEVARLRQGWPNRPERHAPYSDEIMAEIAALENKHGIELCSIEHNASVCDLAESYANKLEAAQAEVERLRAALYDIQAGPNCKNPHCTVDDPMCAAKVAEKSLAGWEPLQTLLENKADAS